MRWSFVSRTRDPLYINEYESTFFQLQSSKVRLQDPKYFKFFFLDYSSNRAINTFIGTQLYQQHGLNMLLGVKVNSACNSEYIRCIDLDSIVEF